MAIYLQKTFHLSSPPIPATPSTIIEGSQLIESSLPSAPAGWNRPVATDAAVFSPDLTDIVMLEEIGPLDSGTAQ
jgi:hypothetical protein